MGAHLPHTDSTAARYAAFMSYAHADELRAAKLHAMLERYRPPRELKAQRHHLRPIFRDKEELTASHSLTDDIRAAVKASRKLIVLCSPAAKASRWVNEEIRLFREFGGEDAIVCALVEGTPETAFPPALTEGGREPLAADLTGSIAIGQGESFRYGMLQLAASLLGVRLDALVRRDQKRRRRFGGAIVCGALAFSGVMGLSTHSAITAREAAITAREAAEASRNDAEGLVEYMITDLKTKLEAVGRLEILDGVGGKVMEYYGGQSIADMPDDRIARQARALHLLGKVALDAGRYEDAEAQLKRAYELTQEIIARSPDDTDAIFAHAQSAFWVGNVYVKTGRLKTATPYWQAYHDLAFRLYAADPKNFDWVIEAASGENNLGILARNTKNYKTASAHYQASITLFAEALALRPNSASARTAQNNAVVGAEQAALAGGNYSQALSLKREGLKRATDFSTQNPNNFAMQADKYIKQSNFLWEYNVFLDAAERSSYAQLPQQKLAELMGHDPENLWWARRYYWHLIISFQLAETRQEQSFYSTELGRAIQFAADTHITEAIRFYTSEVAAQMAILKGDTAKAEKITAEMRRKFRENPKALTTPEIILARLYDKLGQVETAHKYAELYLTRQHSSRLPNMILQRAQAHLVLENCKKAKETLVPLLPFADPAHPHLVPILSCGA